MIVTNEFASSLDARNLAKPTMLSTACVICGGRVMAERGRGSIALDCLMCGRTQYLQLQAKPVPLAPERQQAPFSVIERMVMGVTDVRELSNPMPVTFVGNELPTILEHYQANNLARQGLAGLWFLTSEGRQWFDTLTPSASAALEYLIVRPGANWSEIGSPGVIRGGRTTLHKSLVTLCSTGRLEKKPDTTMSGRTTFRYYLTDRSHLL